MKKTLLALVLLFCFSVNAQTVAVQSFATGFSSAVAIVHPPNDSRLFVVQQAGLIRILNSNGTVNATPFLNLSSIITSGGERGLLGLAFHPNYASNGLFFVNYTNTSGNTVIVKYNVSANPDVASTSGTILMTISQPYSNHNGGSIVFGPDGYLYIGMGDGGSGGDPGNRAQNINENLGKMLRIDVDSASPYGIPASNPYIGVAGNDEIWAIGVRNPWKFSFNRLNGDLWIADVGQNAVEEIDKVASPLPNTGLNFGWKCYEGTVVYNNSGCPAFSSMVAPIAEYTHASSAARCSITGGYFYTGTTYPNFANKYFFADYCSGEIGYVDNSGTITWALDTPSIITTFGEDVNGELYISNGSTISRVIDSSLSNSEFENNSISVYPNPAKNQITIESASNIALKTINIYDISGKLLLSENNLNVSNKSINTSNLTSGLYIIVTEDLSGNQLKSKVIIE
ncbi:PQQ-dependent sugar dehydrogenase [Flavobacterium capsici]|uniref:PQQ-dependent sugar dehydrogenase n=1 Tax=Flavobacterium capsici TaxID=3075618 RepID=A0AA96J662_9FLAO|nr:MULTISPECIES: PQQ-dependent sugar dehydrogenase [unclassified Flavobacterium]WNM19786.1 PQQ-dependent sugar dehydrogenase [Flavobacterium sp. PMR2A8]WNM21175.1 PQQ-dependent sugar dehydrogenase [Flavobacterium sp. PMTSA4]